MDRELPVVGRFFKVLMPGFEKELKLPSAFVRTLNNVDLNSKWTVLKSCKGCWRVDVKKLNDGSLCLFGKRWTDYVSDHELKTRDFIVFDRIGDLHFNTLVFDESCCEKHFVVSENEEEESSEDDVVCHERVENDIDGGGENSQFKYKIAKYNLRYVNVPMAFARSNGLSQKGTVRLRNDATGDSWLATLLVYSVNERKRPCRTRVCISRLTEFFRENKVKVGDECIFKLDHSSRNPNHVVMDVGFVRRH